MANNIELLSNTENFTIGTNSNLSEILANVVRVGTDTSNVTISIPQDISSSYNLILPVRQGASGESLVYGADGQLKWDDPTVLKQVVSVFGSNLGSDKVDAGQMSYVSFPTNYEASITPLSANTKIFVQFKVNYKAALSSDNQVDFFIYKNDTNGNTLAIFSETMYGPYIAAGGFVGQYISNLIDEPNTTDEIIYKLGYKINGTIDLSDTLGILGYDLSYNNTIVLQEFEGSGVYATSVWNKGSDSNGLYYNEGTVHIGSTKNALGSQNTAGVALELSGNLVGTHAYFSGEVNADTINAREAYFSANTLYINNKPVLNEDAAGNRTVNTDVIVSDVSNGLTIKAIGDNGSIILDPSGTGSIQLNGDVQLSGGNINAETFIGDLSGNVNAVTMTATITTTNNLSLDGTLTTSNSTRVEGNLIPSANITYDLGSSTHMWRDVYVGPGSLYVNNKKVIEDNSDTINITTDEGQNLKIKTSGAGGQLQIQSAEGGISMSKTGNTGDITITTTSGGDINMNSHDNIQITAGDDLQLTSTTGTIQLKSAVNITNGMTVSNPTGDDIKIDDNLQITGQVKTNEIIEYAANSGVTIENVLIKDGNVNGNLVGNVTGIVSSLSNHTTDELSEGSTNKYFSTSLVDSHLEGGTGVSYSNGSISIGQSVGTNDNVRFNNVTVDGNLTINGTRTIVNTTTLDIGDNKIVVNAAGSTTDAGIIANVSGTEHEFVYSTNNNAWGTTGDLNIGGNITSTTGYFIGDGSQLTGITDTTYTAGTGLSLDGTMFNNTAPDQTVTITGSGATNVSGTYPNFTISSTDTNTDTNTTYSAGTGLSLDGTTFNNTAPDQNVTITGSGATNVSGTYPNFTISSTDTNTDTNTTYTAGTGLSLDGTMFNNTAPDQTVTITGSGATNVSGTYPNFTISSTDTNTDTNTTYSAGTGLSLDGTTFNNTAPDQNVTITGSGATNVSGTYPNFTISSTDTNTDTNTTYSAGTGVTLSGTTFSIGQSVGTGNDVTFNRVYVNDWFRVNGADGIYWQNYGGGWKMQDSFWIRSVNNKSLLIESDQIVAAQFTCNTASGTPSMYKCMRLASPNGWWGMYINNANNMAIRGTGGESNGDMIFTFQDSTTYSEFEYGGYYLDHDWSGGDGIDFTGQHRSLSNKNLTSDHYGLIVVSSGKYINLNNSLKPTINESLCIVELCKENNSKNVYGVLSNKEDSNEDVRTYKTGGLGQKMKKSNINDDRIIINSLGEGAVWVSNKNGNLINGDYITGSSLIGYGMKQNEDILYNFTVAKITCDCDFNLIKKPKQKIKQIKREKIVKKYQTEIVKKSETKEEIIFDEIINSYVRKNIVTEKEEKVQLYDEYDLYDEDGNILEEKHKVYRFYQEIQYTYEIVYDENGDILFENDLDENGNIQYEYDYERRFLDENANILSGEEEYLSKLNNGDNVYIACLVGCTYHCG